MRVVGRICGDCSACCVALEVTEIGKAAGARCEHMGDTGCGIYEDRPAACRSFGCTWVTGNHPPRSRPDRSGVMAHAYQATTSGGRALPIVVVDELRPGALGGREGKRVLSDCRRRHTVRVRRAS